ncbi:MAG: M20/M25/M40 family metallo-hydrolase, partial [Candidatus Dormibacteraeota bacterium]|nr:M20/M25/M40 family metallo-hydrolase [Candidatus Dormibacteraeota bacterium]
GTTATPTLATAGIAINVVPATASVQVDVRARTVAEQERVDASMQRLQPKTPGARIVVSGGPDRPPLEERHARPLFERARALASAAGIGELEAVEVGGGSDGNITAALGTPTLDGLGAVGGGAHAVDEHIVLSAMQPRTNLVRLLLHDLLQR